MQFLALAVDYDETIATGGVVREETAAALDQVRRSGRRILLVTGRELPELQAACTRLDLFDLVVAENGAVLYDPRTREETLLATPPDPQLARRLKQRAVFPLYTGRVIVATREPHEVAVLEEIRDLGLELQIIFNKGAVMVLPSGVNKATGLKAGLQRLSLSRHTVVGVGDAENDHAFLDICGCSVAVANALPSLKSQVDLVTVEPEGAGVAELARLLIETDLAPPHVSLRRRQVNRPS